MDLPTIDGINTYFVSQKTRAAGVKVALSGLGGDEMFAGYASFHKVPRAGETGQCSCASSRGHAATYTGAVANLTPATDQNRKLATFLSELRQSIHTFFRACCSRRISVMTL